MLKVLELRLRQHFRVLSCVLGGELVSRFDYRIIEVVIRNWHFDRAILGYAIFIVVQFLDD